MIVTASEITKLIRQCASASHGDIRKTYAMLEHIADNGETPEQRDVAVLAKVSFGKYVGMPGYENIQDILRAI